MRPELGRPDPGRPDPGRSDRVRLDPPVRPSDHGQPGAGVLDLRLAVVAATAWGGVLLGLGAGSRWPAPRASDALAGTPGSAVAIASAVVAVLTASLAAGLARHRRARRSGSRWPDLAVGPPSVSRWDLACWVAVLLAGTACGAVHGVATRTSPLAVSAAAGRTVHAVGTVSAVPSPVRSGAPGTVVVRLHVQRLESVRAIPTGPVGDVLVSGDVSVLAPAGWAGVEVGEQLRARLRLQPAPGGRRVQAWAQALGPPGRLAGPNPLHRQVDRVREGLRASCRLLAQPGRGLVPAVVDGDTREVSAATTSDMRVSGLLHLSAVSGANVAILLATATALLGLVGVGRIGTTVVCLGLVGGFTLVADEAPSVLRAGLTTVLGLLGARSGGPGTGLRTLATAAAVVVLTSPDMARDAGFALSVGATAAILLASGGFTTALGRWLPRPLAAALAVSITAQLGAQPVVGALSGQVSLVGPVANLLAAPAVGPITVVGLLAGAVSLLSPGAAAVVALGAGPPAWWLATLAHTCAHLPGAAAPWPAGWLGVGCAVALAVVGLRYGPRLLGRRHTALPAAGVLIGIVAGPLVLPR